MQPETKIAIKQLVTEQVDALHREGMVRYRGVNRRVTFKQEEVYRLVHQDFFGLSTTDAVEVAGITVQDIRQKLTCIAKVAPQLFPILTPTQAMIYRMFMDGYMVMDIAEFFGVTERWIRRVLTLLHRNKKIYFRSDSGRRLGYHPGMDRYITEKF